MGKKGLKICRATADTIRDEFQREIRENGRVFLGIAEVFREYAQNDSRFHLDCDPAFFHGDGPAVTREGEK